MVEKHQKKVTAVKLKQVFSLFKNAVQMSANDNDDMSQWDYKLSNTDFVAKYIAPYVRIIASGIDNVFYDLAGDMSPGYNADWYQLSNGILFRYAYYINAPHWRSIIVDINGKSGPNKVGRDIFAFTFVGNELWTYTQYWNEDFVRTNRESMKFTGTSGQCNPKAAGGLIGPGSYCSTLIEFDGWEIKDDYPF